MKNHNLFYKFNNRRNSKGAGQFNFTFYSAIKKTKGGNLFIESDEINWLKTYSTSKGYKK